jgi:aldehyde dehydrogenase (NAD+)
MGFVEGIALVVNTVVVDSWNNIAAKLISDSVQVPEVPQLAVTIMLALFLAKTVFQWREFIFGGFRARIVVAPPAEADRAWVPTEIYPPAQQSIRDEANPNVIRLFDPTTGGALGKGVAKVFNADDVQGAVDKARKAQASWVKTTFAQRAEVLKVLNHFVVENQDLICRVSCRDTGKTMVDGSLGEVLTTCEKIKWTLSEGEQSLAPEYRSVGVLTAHKTARVEYQPMGVLGAIIPWNYPFHNMFGQIISAIFAGNALVLKVSEHSTWSSEYYIQIVQTALTQLGHDADLVQIVSGFGETGAALIPRVDKLVFIGSPQVGKLVMREASKTLTPVVLELGGKDAVIVCEDADFDQVITHSMRGTFQNCGQNCIGIERLVVHKDIYAKFVSTMTEKVSALSQGCSMDPKQCQFDTGAITMGNTEIARITKLVDQAVSKGAKLVTGGKKNPDLPNGSFMEPTLLVDVTRDMDIACNEVFGPVMTVLRAEDDADAVAIVNSTDYGLGSSVFSLDYSRAEKLKTALRTGMCNLNDFGVNYLCQSLPFGGVNISGFDRFAGIEGIRGCCNMRAVTSDRLAATRTMIPPPMQYPTTPASFQFCVGLVTMAYGDGCFARLKGIAGLAMAALAAKPTKKD